MERDLNPSRNYSGKVHLSAGRFCPTRRNLDAGGAGADNIADKVFDNYEYYGKDYEGATTNAPANRPKFGRGGDLFHVAPNGDLYINIVTDTRNRVDKLSFPQR